MPHGKICYLEIPANSAGDAAAFYSNIFGWKDSLDQIQAAGSRVLTPRTDIGPNMGAFAAFADPVGNAFGLYEEPTH